MIEVSDCDTFNRAATLPEFGQILAKRVSGVPLQNAPFHHYYMQDILPKELYALIRENLPPDHCYRDYRHGDATLPNGRSARLKLDLFPETLVSLPKPLRALVKATAMESLCTSSPM